MDLTGSSVKNKSGLYLFRDEAFRIYKQVAALLKGKAHISSQFIDKLMLDHYELIITGPYYAKYYYDLGYEVNYILRGPSLDSSDDGNERLDDK